MPMQTNKRYHVVAAGIRVPFAACHNYFLYSVSIVDILLIAKTVYHSLIS